MYVIYNKMIIIAIGSMRDLIDLLTINLECIMKRLFTLSCSILFVSSALADVEPTLTQLWEFSTAKGNLIEVKDVRNGFSFYDGELYLASRRGADTEVVIYDATTGQPKLVETNVAQLPASSAISMAWAGGDVAIDKSGAIYCVASNTASVVKWDSKTATPTVFATFPASGVWAFDVQIDNEGNGCIIGAVTATSNVYYIPVTNNVPGAVKTFVLSTAPGAVPRVHIVDSKTFWVDGTAIKPTLVKLSADLSSIAQETAIVTTAISVGVNGVAQFDYNGKTYLIVAANNHGEFGSVPKHSALIFELNTETLEVTQVGTYFPSAGLGGTTDGSHFVKPVVDVTADAAIIYLMGGMDGLTAYKLEAPAPIVVADPVFDPIGGVVENPTSVAITTTTAGATIRYTLDGTEPIETSTEYTAPIVLTESATIKAKAWLAGAVASNVVSASYTITPTSLTENGAEATSVYSANGLIVVKSALVGTSIEVYNLQGVKVLAVSASGDDELALDKGIYLVKVGADVFKVVL